MEAACDYEIILVCCPFIILLSVILIGNATFLITGFGQAKALLEWHNTSRFCGHCGAKTVPMEAGKRKQCSIDSCKKRIYPRVDPVCHLML